MRTPVFQIRSHSRSNVGWKNTTYDFRRNAHIKIFTTKTYDRVKHRVDEKLWTQVISSSQKKKLRLTKILKKTESYFVYSYISVIARRCRLIPFEYSVRAEENVRMLWALRHVPRTREMNLSRHLCALLTITDTSSSILFPCPRLYSAHNRHEHAQWRLPITAFGAVWSVRRVSTPAALVIFPQYERLVLHNNDPHSSRPSNLIRERVISSICNVYPTRRDRCRSLRYGYEKRTKR